MQYQDTSYLLVLNLNQLRVVIKLKLSIMTLHQSYNCEFIAEMLPDLFYNHYNAIYIPVLSCIVIVDNSTECILLHRT